MFEILNFFKNNLVNNVFGDQTLVFFVLILFLASLLVIFNVPKQFLLLLILPVVYVIGQLDNSLNWLFTVGLIILGLFISYAFIKMFGQQY
jgi:hypothetical protein